MHRRDFFRSLLAWLAVVACRAGDALMPRTLQGPVALGTGPWKGVFDTPDPLDGNPSDRLVDLLNGYIPDPKNGSGAFARNGFGKAKNGTALTTAGGALYGQGVYQVTMLDGTTLNFSLVAGKLLRLTNINDPSTSVTDVTPVGISINTGVGPVYITSCVSNEGGTTQVALIVNDQVNKPWVGTNLTGSPITGTYINYDGLGSAWKAIGQPVIWQGCVIFVLDVVNGVARREDISWGEPGLPLTGYQQATYDNNMTLTLPGGASPGQLYALYPTNVALYYFRAESIGAIAGDIADLRSSNTTDAISFNVGCTAPRTIQGFGDRIYFCDNLGRPNYFRPGNPPVPIWEQMRGQTRTWGSNASGQLATYASSAIEPTRNLYLVAPRRSDPNAADTVHPTTIYAFDARTGTYVGRWTIGDTGTGGIGISCMGTLGGLDGGEPVLFVIGESAAASGLLGYGWYFRTRGFPSPDSGQWYDGASYPNVQVTTDRQGEDPNVVYYVDRLTALTGTASKVAFSVATSTKAFTSLGLALATLVTPAASADESYRCVLGLESQGRGPAVRVWPQPDDVSLDQWSIHRIVLNAVPSNANPMDDA